jgi:DNA-directed RNA polymerase specialized sigma24 family protein
VTRKEAPVIDSSFVEFVHGHVTSLERYAYALTGDRHAADDLVQETLIRVAAAWRRIHEDGNPAGYATTVMFRT